MARETTKQNLTNEVDEDFTERVLLSLVFDISLLHESVQRVRVQVYALAKERGIPVDQK